MICPPLYWTTSKGGIFMRYSYESILDMFPTLLGIYNFTSILKQGDFLYNFRFRTRIAGGFMFRDYVANQSKDNNKRGCNKTAP